MSDTLLEGRIRAAAPHQPGELVHREEDLLHLLLRLDVHTVAPAVAGGGPDDLLLHPGLPHQLLGLFAVLLRPALKIQVVEQTHDPPELLPVPIAQLPGKPAHHVLHCNGVAQVELLLVILGQQVPGLLSCHGHL